MCCDVAGAQAGAEAGAESDWIRSSSALPTAGPRVLTQKQASKIRLCHEHADNRWIQKESFGDACCARVNQSGID